MAKAYLYPKATSFTAGTVSVAGAATAHEACSDDKDNPDEGSSYVRILADAAGDGYVFFDFADMPAAISVQEVLLVCRFRRDASDDARRRMEYYVDGTRYAVEGSVLGVAAFETHTRPAEGAYYDPATHNPATGDPWTSDDINSSLYGGLATLDGTVPYHGFDLTQCYLEVTYTKVPEHISETRDVGGG